MKSIGAYWNVGPSKESEWKALLGTGEYGTPPKNMITALKDLGLGAKTVENMSVPELTYQVSKGRPVICPIQAWGSSRYYSETWSGHWLCVIGFDQHYIYCEDSYITGARGYISKAKFLNRWHDTDGKGRYWPQLGIVVKGPEPQKTKRLFQCVEIW